MNGGSIFTPDLITENGVDSDSDARSDESPDYYQAINDDDDDDGDDQDSLSNGQHHVQNGVTPSEIEDEDDNGDDQHSLSNGQHHVQNGVTLSEIEDEDDIRRMSESDSAIRTAFLADEARRYAPLPPDHASRVIQAMRRVSLPAFPPLNVPDHLWLHQLHRLRLPPP